MPDAYLLETGTTDRYLLEDDSGVLLLDDGLYSTDFSEYTAGSPPSDWSFNAAISSTDTVSWDVVADGAAKVLRIVSGTVQQRRAFWWNVVPLAADIEVLYKARVGSGSGDSYLQQHVRHNGAAPGSDITYMSTQLSGTQRELFLINAPAATFTQLAVGSATVAAGTVYWFRTRVNGTSLWTRFWLDGTTEPEGWLLSATNGAITAAGRAAVGLSNPNRTQDILYFAVAVGGGTAPLPVGSTAHTRTVTEDLGASDSRAQVSAGVRSEDDGLGPTDSLAQAVFTAHVRTVTDSLGSAESVTRVAASSRTVTDPLGGTDTQAQAGASSRTVTDALGGTDTRSQVSAAVRSEDDGLGGTDTLGESHGLFTWDDGLQSWVADTGSGGSPSVAHSTTVKRDGSGALASTGTFPATGFFDHEVYHEYAEGQRDRTALGSSYSVWFKPPAGLANVGGKFYAQTTDFSYYSGPYVVASTDTWTQLTWSVPAAALSDMRRIGVSWGGDSLNAALTAWIDTLQVEAVPARTVTDSLGGTDSLSRVAPSSRTLSDALGGSDTRSQVTVSFRQPTDGLGSTDSLTQSVSTLHQRTVTEDLGPSDARIQAAQTRLTSTDALGGSDSLALSVGHYRTRTESLGGTDSRVQAQGHSRAVTENLGATDARSQVSVTFRSQTDGLGPTDMRTQAAQGANSRTVNDLLGGADSRVQAAASSRTVTDGLGASDSVTVVLRRTRTVTDGLGPTDTVAVVGVARRQVTDGAQLTDTLSQLASTGAVRQLTEALGASDALTYSLITVSNVGETELAASRQLVVGLAASRQLTAGLGAGRQLTAAMAASRQAEVELEAFTQPETELAAYLDG